MFRKGIHLHHLNAFILWNIIAICKKTADIYIKSVSNVLASFLKAVPKCMASRQCGNIRMICMPFVGFNNDAIGIGFHAFTVAHA